MRQIIVLQRLMFTVLLLFASSAHAHSPYLIKQGMIAAPNGGFIIKEKLYGDGIFFADPTTFQLRSENGALLANSPVGDHVATFCPSINFCWAFPYFGGTSFLSTGWYIDTQVIEFDQPALDYNLEDKKGEQFHSYLSDKNVKNFSRYSLGYPQHDQPSLGFKQSGISTIFSPFMIIADQFRQLLAILFLTFVPFVLYWLIFKWKKIERKVIRYPVYLLGTFLILKYLEFYSLIMSVIEFTLSTPWLYMLVFMIAGIVLGILFLRKMSKSR